MTDYNQVAFHLWDRDHSNLITCAHFGDMMRNLGEDVEVGGEDRIISTVDKSKSGAVSFHDFLNVINKSDAKDSDPVVDAFNAIDKDGDGEVSFNDLFDFLELMGAQPEGDEVSLLFEELDLDKDGKISKEDWIKASSS